MVALVRRRGRVESFEGLVNSAKARENWLVKMEVWFVRVMG